MGLAGNNIAKCNDHDGYSDCGAEEQLSIVIDLHTILDVMQNVWRESFEWADLPLWRKLLVVSFFGLFFVVGYHLFSMDTDIYTTAPSSPVPETKQIVPIHVNHGYLRYVTDKEAEDYKYWYAMTPAFLGAIILGMFASVMTYRHGKTMQQRGQTR